MSRFRSGVARPRSNPRAPVTDAVERRQVGLIDELAEFEEYKSKLLPEIAKLVKGGAPSKDILERSKALAVARLALIAVNEADPKTALNAIKEVLDRTDGKVTDKREVTHAMQNLKDEELDALLIASSSDVEDE